MEHSTSRPVVPESAGHGDRASALREMRLQSAEDLALFEATTSVFDQSEAPLLSKIESFPIFATRQSISRFLARAEIFRRVLGVPGVIIEGGVLWGSGLLTWAKLSSIYEPHNYYRRVVGFDTFSGFPSVSKMDTDGSRGELLNPGDLRGASLDEVQRAAELFDIGRPLSHIPKIELVPGDIESTAEAYLKSNPHTIVSLLYLDVDLYEPTRSLLETFAPRVPKGGIIAFDQLGSDTYPGETVALLDTLGIASQRLRRVEHFPSISYFEQE